MLIEVLLLLGRFDESSDDGRGIIFLVACRVSHTLSLIRTCRYLWLLLIAQYSIDQP